MPHEIEHLFKELKFEQIKSVCSRSSEMEAYCKANLDKLAQKYVQSKRITQDKLLAAIKDKKCSMVEMMIRGGVQKPDDILIFATSHSAVECVRFLLSRNETNINVTDIDGNTAFLEASAIGNSSLINLLAPHSNVNHQNKNGESALMLSLGIIDATRAVIDLGVNLELRDSEGDTALSRAVAYGRDFFDSIVLLINAGANVNVTDRHGKTPLMRAASNGEADIVRKLLYSKADKNIKTPRGDTALSLADLNGHREVIRVLREQHGSGLIDGFKPLVEDSTLIKLYHKGDYQTLVDEIRKGSNPNVHYQGEHLLTLLAQDTGNLEENINKANVISYVLSHGSDVNAFKGQALITAAQTGNVQAVRMILERGKGIFGDHLDTALDVAEEPRVIDMLETYEEKREDTGIETKIKIRNQLNTEAERRRNIA